MQIIKISVITIVLVTTFFGIQLVFAQNVTNSTSSMPSNAIRTQNGGWVTPLQTTDQNGKNLTLHYETGVPVTGYANPGPPPDPIFLTDSKGNIDNFFTNHQILLRADAWPESPDTRTIDVEINMTSDTGFAFDDKKHLIFEPNATHMKQIIWQFIPTKVGNYTVEKFSNGMHTSSTFFSVSDLKSGSNYPVLVSPLRQLKWGIMPENIQCQTNFVLILKSEDGSPACVKPDDVSKLVERGWADKPNSLQEQLDLEHPCIGPNIACRNVESNSLSESDCGQFYTVPENHTSLNTVPVLLMKTNSTACAKLTFTIISNYNDCNGPNCQHVLDVKPTGLIGNLHYEKHDGSFSITPGKNYDNSFKIVTIPSTVDLANYPVGTNYTVTYTIRPLANATGFYDQSIPRLACERYPLAVGYTADQVNASDFSYIDPLNPPCVSGAYVLTKVEISGMDYKEVILQLAVLEQGK
ncbi:MAG: hypothetical protein KGI05_00980 [Thaumarchaeota archaeon]|nr:hypothetical protein [Candidatus Nitrosotalea sp.]MDE1813213.1 hypothetical protein [Nitrososphaerota archaeon]